MSKRRFFNAGERAALFLAADGRCGRCGAELEPGWHGDHMTAFSRGGETDVVNGEALCPKCNREKGSTLVTPRKWQADALKEFMLFAPEGDNGFLVEATPGAGKTRLAVDIAHRLLEAGHISRIIIAVPTARLETQWAEVFATKGININPHWKAADGTLARDVRGCAATYAEIIKQPQIYRRLAGTAPALVILDEVHHCGEDRSWGQAVRTAFQPAVRKLLLSGTPFRSTNDAIPFVRYVDGVGAPDFRYGYDSALADRVVRAVFFPRRGGQMEWEWKGKAHSATFNEKLSEDAAQKRLRTALSIKGQWIPQVLADADQQLAQLRESDPTAGGIVFCENQWDAREVEKMLLGMRRTVVLAISDEPDSDARIGAFAKSRDHWIVSVRKVSEGVDIPRLRVGVYATTWVTELFFRQVVGRLVRTRPDEEDPTAYLFIPDDERLRQSAEQIKHQREHVLDRQVAEQGDLFDELEGGGGGGPATGAFLPVSAVASDQGIIVDAVTVTPDELARAEKLKMLSPLTAGIATAHVALLLRNNGATMPAPPTADALAAAPQFERVKRLKDSNNTIVRRIAMAHGYQYSHVQAALNQAVGLPAKGGFGQATEDQLRRRLGMANEWLRTGQHLNGGSSGS